MRIESKPLWRSLVILLTFGAQIAPAYAGQEKSSARTLSFAATCPAKTANYITHNLPQLCLTSSRSSPTNATSTQSESSVSTGADDQIFIVMNLTSTLNPSTTESAISEQLFTHPLSVTHGSETLTQPAKPTETCPDTLDAESESDLGNAKFLSFEDWKKENLAIAGQSEHVGRVRPDGNDEARKKPASIPTALDSIGDDAEIDLDFSAFAAEKPGVVAPNMRVTSSLESSGGTEHEFTDTVKAKSRSEDAGTTYKERFNYASFDCAATVLKTNPQVKGASAVLGENKDSYMLIECSADNKFLILELCHDILIDTIVLANFEFFSSMVRTFRVSVSDRYPVKAEKWKTLGTFEARNSREVQAFLVENPLIWARYLRVEFLTHYGNEYYCPVSLIRVHGTTMMEEYKHELESSRVDEDEEGEGLTVGADDEEQLVPEAVAGILVQEKEDRNQGEGPEQAATDPAVTEAGPSEDQQDSATSVPVSTKVEVETSPNNGTSEELARMQFLFTYTQPICSPQENSDGKLGNVTVHLPSTRVTSSDGSMPVVEQTSLVGSPRVSEVKSSPLVSQTQSSTAHSLSKPASHNATADKAPMSPSISHVQASKSANASQAESTKSAASSTQPSPASPTIQESFFKSVQKRLQMLESNSSLSLQYIEEQSRNLRDAFGRVEQRQLAKTNTFLDYLNSTVLSELRDFRQQYDQLWQSTVIELETQREQYQQEVSTINSRLAVLADEVIFQKRMSILQTVLVLLCLGLVLFSRGAMNNYLELPIVQNMLARSSSLRMLNSHMLQSPSESPATTRPNSSHKHAPPHGILKRHQRQTSEDSVGGTPSTTFAYSPPTPTSYEGMSDAEEANDIQRFESSDASLETAIRPNSSPPMLSGAEDAPPRTWEDDRGEKSNDIPAHMHELQIPIVNVEEATPPAKHLSFRLPDD